MKRSEIIDFLKEKQCKVQSFYRDGSTFCIYLRYISGSELKALEDKGFIIFLSGAGANMLLEITGYIEWD